MHRNVVSRKGNWHQGARINLHDASLAVDRSLPAPFSSTSLSSSPDRCQDAIHAPETRQEIAQLTAQCGGSRIDPITALLPLSSIGLNLSLKGIVVVWSSTFATTTQSVEDLAGRRYLLDFTPLFLASLTPIFLHQRELDFSRRSHLKTRLPHK